jgi:hypothetical protein
MRNRHEESYFKFFGFLLDKELIQNNFKIQYLPSFLNMVFDKAKYNKVTNRNFLLFVATKECRV